MAEQFSLLEFILHLLNDEGAREHFSADPYGELAEHGLEDLSAEDVHDALVLIQDSHTASFDRSYDTGHNAIATGSFHLPPVPVHAGPESHKAAVEYLNTYITNNYVDDRDTIVDNSINQNIDNRGGYFEQDIDVDSVVASGDGAVAAGGDIEDSTITTGNGNVVGDGNHVVNGHDNTTAFGRGDATSTEVGGDVNLGDGAAFASGGGAVVHNTDNSTNDSFNDFSDNSTNDSFNDHSDYSVEDSFNVDIDESTNDSYNDNSANSVEDSGNTAVNAGTTNSYNQDIALG
ncbi:IniB N-terminal domain-containing protein [Pseudonocardia acidicola]|uniref:Dentin sialophosphoprotein n=1 Tax=Pseudonocardia acidicola TaxID=2724939 RepID=A0ABX1SDF2_9PSEU|nr:IniB N-terminal domain-containing protein [Pseudonocardia acidicola]NMH98939.1 hypothetical protein [Pseudonocardia acidicola]